ncbi:hypothetical protein J5N97_006548 [Dioscorea zingiberensis]|uniref:Uncharacterized protein n=1 Tax=Dioscorea zingiberensis TaxID=325984 RepID=A0A9D5DD99_9LILI|nr:hypothetical protein J5N97_006548 [Dioscorea zingiberensis]
MAKQKMVVKLTMEDAKKRSKALKIAVGFTCVTSAGLEGESKDRLVVVGDGVDSINLTRTLRKKMGHVELVSVAAFDEKKLDGKKENNNNYKQSQGAGEAYNNNKSSQQPAVILPYQYQAVPQPYIYYGYCDNYKSYNEPSCSLM